MGASVSQHQRRRGMAVALAAATMGVASLSFAASAPAAQLDFCSGWLVGPAGSGSAGCHEQTYKKITRVNARSINNSVCASALNGNGVVTGGWVCTASAGTASNGNYSGNLWLRGLVTNNAPTAQYIWGTEYYNP